MNDFRDFNRYFKNIIAYLTKDELTIYKKDFDTPTQFKDAMLYDFINNNVKEIEIK